MTTPLRLTIQQAAEYVGMPLKTFYNKRSLGLIPVPGIKLGDGRRARVVYDRRDLDAWLASRKEA